MRSSSIPVADLKRACAKRAEYHDRRKRDFEWAASRPWIERSSVPGEFPMPQPSPRTVAERVASLSEFMAGVSVIMSEDFAARDMAERAAREAIRERKLARSR